MTALITIALTAVLLIAAWLLGQLPTGAKRLAVAFALSWAGYGAVRAAEQRGVSEAVQTGLLIALFIAAAAVAWWLIQPWLWGIEDYLPNSQRKTKGANSHETS